MNEILSANKQVKRAEVDEIKQMIQGSNSFVVLDYKGLSVLEDTEFRSNFRKAGVEYKVVKNTLLRLALNELGYSDFDAELNGPTAVAFAKADPMQPAKIAAEGIKKYNKMAMKCGMFDKKFTDQATTMALSKIPNKETLLAMLLSVLQAPIRKLAVAAKAVAEQKS